MDNEAINTQLAYDAREELHNRPREELKQEVQPPPPPPPPPTQQTQQAQGHAENQPMSAEDVDQLLLAGKRIIRNRSRKACYPCAKRKIRCDRDECQPCSNCRKQPHPDLCNFEPDEPRRFTKKRSSPPPPRNFEGYSQTPSSQPYPVPNSSPAFTTPQSAPSYGYQPYPPSPYGPASAEPVPKRARIASPPHRPPPGYPQGPAPAYGYAPAQGSPIFPSPRPPPGDLPRPPPAAPNGTVFAQSMPSDDMQWQQLQAILPQQKDVLRFNPVYKDHSKPFNPIVFDFDGLESGICNYLEDLNADRLRSRLISQDRRHSEYGLSWIALLLATLAQGAQLSEGSFDSRTTSSQDYVRRSMMCLRSANFLLRPVNESIQALLVLANVLQNDGQLSASHVFIGMAVRLAQSRSLHVDSLIENNQIRRKHWWLVCSQDALFSLAYGRPPSVSIPYEQDPPFDSLWREKGLTYTECLFAITKQIVIVLHGFPDQVRRRVHSNDLEHLSSIRGEAESKLKSKSNCRTMEDRMQYHALQIHASFATACICVTALRVGDSEGRLDSSNHALNQMVQKCKASLLETVQAFVDLESFSQVPPRSWIMVQAALSSAVLLGIMGEIAENKSTKEAVLGLHAILSRVHAGKSGDEANFRLSRRHVRAVEILSRLCLDPKAEAWNSAPGPEGHSTNGGFTAVPGYQRYGEEKQVNYLEKWHHTAAKIGSTDLKPIEYWDNLFFKGNATEDEEEAANSSLEQQELWGL
ncbi:MAG: hypothetical protein Q9227_002088 [Pyrenula ochraceoflavens]